MASYGTTQFCHLSYNCCGPDIDAASLSMALMKDTERIVTSGPMEDSGFIELHPAQEPGYKTRFIGFFAGVMVGARSRAIYGAARSYACILHDNQHRNCSMNWNAHWLYETDIPWYLLRTGVFRRDEYPSESRRMWEKNKAVNDINCPEYDGRRNCSLIMA